MILVLKGCLLCLSFSVDLGGMNLSPLPDSWLELWEKNSELLAFNFP
jgi:hypothetical protein